MKQKKYTNVAPTSSEIDASNVCRQLKISFENFQQSKSKLDPIEFTQFTRDFEVFLKEETNKKLLNYFPRIIIENIIVHVCSFTFEPDLVHQTFHLLNLIVSKTGVTFSAISYMTLFLFLTNGDEERFNILKNERISIDIFSDELFFSDFINESMFNLTFQKLFLTVSSKEICQFYTNLIFKVSPLNLLSDYDFQPLIDNFRQQRPNVSIFPEISVFLSGLFSINDKFKFYFNDKQNFELLSELLNDAPFDSIIECFTYLIFIDPPNFSLLTNVVDFYRKNLRIQSQFFDSGFKLIQSHPEIANEVNSAVTFSEWITPQTPTSKLIYVMKLVNSIDVSLVSQFLPCYFSKVEEEKSDNLEYLIFGIDTVESLIYHHLITLDYLFNSLFLKVFVIQPSIDMLSELFEKSETFVQIVYDIYSLPEAESIRPDVLEKVIHVAIKNNELVSIVSGFLAISGTSKNLREIMKLIDDTKNGCFCEALIYSFSKSATLVINFLREYGLKWIDSIFNQKIIDIQMVKNLIIGLTKRLANKNVDEFIESLPKDHPLFSLEEGDIHSLVYGFETPPVYFPIKVYSLFHLITCPEKVDPYNASLIGSKKVLKKCKNLMNLPILKDVANRYITDDIFYQLLKTPTELEQFADPSYDHFPLFQLFEYAFEKVYEMKFRSISFWIRFDKKIDDSLKVPFFHASKFSLFYKSNNLIANYEGTEYLVPINPLQWNHIFVSFSPKVLSHKVKIYVNLNKAVFASPVDLSEFDDFGFLVYASYLFIGPAIRIYNSKTHDLNTIFELGPSSLTKLNEDHLIVPSSDFLADRNMLPVPYYGFPEHFKSEKKLNYFFEILKKTENDIEFDKILSLYFKVYLIIKNSNVNLFSSLLTFFASSPEKLTEERFCKVLDFFSENENKKILLDEILRNILFWKNVSNNFIISSLVSYFKTFDFLDDFDKFQFFLSSKIIQNQTSKEMMTTFLNDSKTLPKCQECLVKLFQCHHYMYQRQNKEIQCEFQSTKKSDNSAEKEEKEEEQNDDEHDQYLLIFNKRNISVQCEINLDNEENKSSCFDEQFLLFYDINNTELQFNMIDCFYDFFNQSESIENIKSIIPLDDMINLFVISQNAFKRSFFKIFVLIEKKSPGILVVNNLFLTAFFPLFIYQDIWDQVMDLVTDIDGTTMKSTPIVCLILALIWSLTVVSLHSVARTGKTFQLSFNKEIQFCLTNVKNISLNKSAQHFMTIWYPLLLGFENNKSDISLSSIKIEGTVISPPKVSDLSYHIWKTVIQAAREIDNNLPLRTDQFFFKEFKSFIPNSDLFIFHINVILSSSKDQFIHFFSPILCVLLVSEKEIAETFVCQFVTSSLTILSQTFQSESLIIHFIPILHYMSSSGLMKFNFQFILSSIFVIVTRLSDLYSKSFMKALPSINNLMISIFSNCEDESLPVLFNILQQNAQIFSELSLQSPNTTENYLCFFQKVAHNCYNEFDTFFKKFLEITKIDQKNKKVEDLLNHVEIQDNSIMNKWNKALNSLGSITKLVKNEKSNCFQSMMSELLVYSKELTKTYFICQKRQKEFSQFLKKNFNAAENVTNSQEYFNYSIEKLFESINGSITVIPEKNEVDRKLKKLLPFSFPASLPRLFVPAPIQSHEEAIQFIIDNKLYMKKAKLNLAVQKANLDDSEKVSKSIFKRRTKRTNSNMQGSPQPVSKMTVIETEGAQQMIDRKLKRRQSMVSPTKLPNLLVYPIVINCRLRRFNYAIPTILTLKPDEMELAPFCGRNSSSFSPNANYPLNPELVAQFVMEVINGFWGITTVSDGKIVIKIPLNSIIALNQNNSKSVTFWTMTSGTFALDNIESIFFDNQPFQDISLFTSHDSLKNKNEVIQNWIQGTISTSQMIVLLNICEGNGYIDQNKFIQFPGTFSVFGTFSPINESLHSNLIDGLMTGDDRYSNSIELKENINSIVDFVKKIGVKESIEKLNRPSPHFTTDSQILCQKLEGTVPSFSLLADDSIITDLPPLTSRVSCTCPIYICVDRNESSVYLFDVKAKKKIFSINSEEFSTARSISISQRFMFFAIDLRNGKSFVYRILYESGLPSKIELVNKRLFLYDQTTTVNDSELVAATFYGKTVYIWPFYRFSYHRVLNFERKIRFCQFDDNSGTFWVCDNFSCYLFDLNGKLFSKHKFEKKISAFAVVPQPIFECERTVICGFNDGSIVLISPKIESAELFVKDLKKCHNSKIERISFSLQNFFFLTVDDCQNAFFWTKKNVGDDAKEFDINVFEGCPSCGNKPLKFCTSCKRAFCAECLKDSQICPECLPTNL